MIRKHLSSAGIVFCLLLLSRTLRADNPPFIKMTLPEYESLSWQTRFVLAAQHLNSNDPDEVEMALNVLKKMALQGETHAQKELGSFYVRGGAGHAADQPRGLAILWATEHPNGKESISHMLDSNIHYTFDDLDLSANAGWIRMQAESYLSSH